MKMNRRNILKAAAAGAAASFLPASSWARLSGANERVRIGVIGTGGMGTVHLRSLVGRATAENIEVVRVCDVYRRRLNNAVKVIGASESAGSIEHERVLDDKGVDAVLIATPDHWHTRIANQAMEAGKDVYCEKPLSLTAEQAIECRNVQRKTGRVLQVGPQGTSEERWWAAGEAIKAGRIGPVVWSQGSYCRNSREGQFNWTIDPDAGPQNAPAAEGYVDWDRWLGHAHGLAPKRSWDADRFFRFRKYYDYNGGVATDLMYHRLAPLTLAVAGPDGQYPFRVSAAGGLYVENDGRDIGDTMILTVDYREPVAHTVVLISVMINDVGVPDVIRGQTGQMEPAANGWKLTRQNTWKDRFAKANEDLLKGEDKASVELACRGDRGGRDHLNNWIDAIRGKSKVNCNIELGCATMVAIKMGVEAFRQNKTFMWDAKGERMYTA
ncbi:MAG: Gfo/Idh/MocA family oxidoreductase [Phycisphaeraceae bacterium]|nr:MAG: Gfo/Idh/MocA family oxidoreductase [Phycisphaeraceae bacterium]